MTRAYDLSGRHGRKALVFHIMYGTFPGLADAELAAWRLQCAAFIYEGGPVPPLSLPTKGA